MASPLLRTHDIDQIRQAAAQINHDPSKYITIASLADDIGLNTDKLKRGFRQLFNSSVYQYVIIRRLQKALHLLEETDLPIKQIAYKTGFDSKDGFSRSFQSKFHTTPSSYRKKYLLSPDQNISLSLGCMAFPNLN